MPLPHSIVVTPSTSFLPSDTNLSSTPPPPSNAHAAARPHTSPSPRTRLPDRDFASPASSNTHHHRPHRSVDGSSAENHPGPPSPHITFASTTAPPPNFIAASSLLPHAWIADSASSRESSPHTRHLPHEPSPPSGTPEQAKELEPPRARGHSRSSSAGGLSDGIRNLNRWSASTTSSRASNLTGFTRRISVDVFGAVTGSPGRKLHKSRPSTSSVSPRSGDAAQARSESPPPAPVPPLQSLPRISIGPSLEEEVRQANVLGRDSPIQRPRYIRRPSHDSAFYWDGAPQIPEEHSGLSSQLDSAESLLPAATITPGLTMPYNQNGGEPRGHSRSRSTGANGSADTTSSSVSRNRDRDRDRDRDIDRNRDRDRDISSATNKPPSQKAMLSKALKKAQSAVQLDNAQNAEGARSAYSEACTLLQHVLRRTTAEEDRRKLEAIHTTYTSRIAELEEQLYALIQDRREPSTQQSENDDVPVYMGAQIDYRQDDERSDVISSALTRDRDRDRDYERDYSAPASAARPNEQRDGTSSYLTEQYSLQSAFSRFRYDNGSSSQEQSRVDNGHMPPPLSPRRLMSPTKPPPPPPRQQSPERGTRADLTMMSGARLAPSAEFNGHRRGNSHESVSWLDPIDESGGSSASSIHSRSSSMGIRRKHLRAASGKTEAEFDAALDDAIEAAYDDGYEQEAAYGGDVYRRVELARRRVRESEREAREALELANAREQKLRLQQQLEDEEYRKQEGLADEFYDDGNDSEEEERVLEEMTRGYAIEDFALRTHQKTAIPRESDSSGMTSRTWHTSISSNPQTATTVLTPVSEVSMHPQPTGPLPPPPTGALPQVPQQPSSAGSQASTLSVQNRRLSSHNLKQLKIETTTTTQSVAPATAGPAFPQQQQKTSSYIVQQRQALSAGPNRTTDPLSLRPSVSPAPGHVRDGSSTPPLPMGFVPDDQSRSSSPAVSRPGLRENFSSTSLKSIKSRNLSVSHIDDASDLSPGTPLTSHFGNNGSTSRLPSLPSIPTPLGGFRDRADTFGSGGMHLFNDEIHSPNELGSPNLLLADAPVPLEPCPNDVMLRPFWLMRCLYQTLCHPHGGYLSNKLFVPRDVWRVKGVKLKNIEDKIANCDYLTAALQKLSLVDTCDADAVLEEMQALEGVLEQVQATLTRKLGSEVGVQSTNVMFKDAAMVENESTTMPRSGSVSAKNSSFSWRRLRSKNSSANLPGLASSYGGKGGSGGASTPIDGSVGNVLLPSLPMTTHPTTRPTKRDVGMVQFAGPNANYMSSLARLFDAAQCIDQIARQVDDPGLRHADKTQVGLELCTRHAAEFFGFFICRFVMSDLMLMLDKFLKRGSEWVIA